MPKSSHIYTSSLTGVWVLSRVTTQRDICSSQKERNNGTRHLALLAPRPWPHIHTTIRRSFRNLVAAYDIATAPEYPPHIPAPAPAGKAATPHRHEQLHWPLFIVPVPWLIEVPAAARFCGDAGAGIAGAAAGGRATGPSTVSGGGEAGIAGAGADGIGAGGGGEAAGGGEDTGGGMTIEVEATIMLLLPPILIVSAAVPFCCMAICMNMAGVLSAVGLMLKVMP